jgi:hypothetical protein
MSTRDVILSMAERLVVGESRRRSEKIRLYSHGLLAKLRNAELALDRIRELSPTSDLATAGTADTFSIEEQIYFYTDSFFAFLYSALDVVSQVVNQKLRMSLDERSVSFKVVGRNIAADHAGSHLEIEVERILRSTFFKNLERYRNCSTHRRQIFIRVHTEYISATPGYSSTGPVLSVRRVICDDPLSLSPSTAQNRELVSYCGSMYLRACTELEKIATNI